MTKPRPAACTTLGFIYLALPTACGGGGEDSTPISSDPKQSTISDLPASTSSCAITATLVAASGAEGDSGSGHPLPVATQQFSLLIDWVGDTATTGVAGTASKVKLVKSAGEWTTQEPVELALALATDWPSTDDVVGPRPLIRYDRITVHPTTEGCAGHATGTYLGMSGDVLFDIPLAATLAGVNDVSGPSFTVQARGKSELHPLDLQGLAADELLPVATRARLLSREGAEVPLTSLPAGSLVGVSAFLVEERALAFAASYQLEVSPRAIDLAGNATVPPVLTTMIGPGLFAQDGFEGPVDALLGGNVRVVDATSLPIPAGHQAIRFAPIGLGTSKDWSCDDRFTARLAVGPTATTVKMILLSYRSSQVGPFMAWLRLAVPNGAVRDFSPYWMPTHGTSLPRPWTGTLPGADVNSYGALVQIELPLPAGAGSEIIFDLYRPCTEPLLGGDGAIIDDLRVE